MRFADIVAFQEELVNRINATYVRSQKETGYSPFLKSFGKTLVAASIKPTEVSEIHYIIDELKDLKREVAMLRIENAWEEDNSSKKKYKTFISSPKSNINVSDNDEFKDVFTFINTAKIK